MRKNLSLVAVMTMTALVACGRGPSPERAAPPPKAPVAAAPSGSKLAKVTPGMKQDEVEAILGRADDQASHETGKRWVPYNMGTDVRREVWAYKGVGRVVFKTDNAFKGGRYIVDHTEYDTSEDGKVN